MLLSRHSRTYATIRAHRLRRPRCRRSPRRRSRQRRPRRQVQDLSRLFTRRQTFRHQHRGKSPSCRCRRPDSPAPLDQVRHRQRFGRRRPGGIVPSISNGRIQADSPGVPPYRPCGASSEMREIANTISRTLLTQMDTRRPVELRGCTVEPNKWGFGHIKGNHLGTGQLTNSYFWSNVVVSDSSFKIITAYPSTGSTSACGGSHEGSPAAALAS